MTSRSTRKLTTAIVWTAALMAGTRQAGAQSNLAWDQSPYFRYNVLESRIDPATGGLVVRFSVTNPLANNAAWNIKNDAPFRLPGARLFLQVGWDTRDYTNLGATDPLLRPQAFGTGVGAAAPLPVNLLATAQPVGDGTFIARTKPLPPGARGTGNVVIEGHPVVPLNGANVAVPVKSVFKYIGITDRAPVPRREVVDINKCQSCHTGVPNRAGEVIPRLSLHGGNRTEELRACVVCHNANQTDIAYRRSGAEVSVDFKRLIHGIHSGGFRHDPLVVVGFQGTTHDFSGVRFPRELSDCTNCHIDNGRKATYELPLSRWVLGSTVSTGSVPGVSVDINPANDLKITPIAAVCSSCHDSPEDINHMKRRRGGASFATTQARIDSGNVVERCQDCHGRGKIADVRWVHEIGEDD